MNRSVKVAEFSDFNWQNQPREVVKYSDIINFERAGARGEHHCVMCGRVKGAECEIPNQNKDVCKTCDSAYWRLTRDDAIVKFCKGCKKFSSLSDFADKPEASKCAKCRHRGRQNYYSRKQGDDLPSRKKVPANTSSTKAGIVSFDQVTKENRSQHIHHGLLPTSGLGSDEALRAAFSPRSMVAQGARGAAGLHGLKSSHPLPPPQFHGSAFGGGDGMFADTMFDDPSGRRSSMGSTSSRSSSSRSGIDCSARNSLDSSEDDVLMRSFTHRGFGHDDPGYHNSSSGNNSSLGSAEFSFMVSPVLGQAVGVLHGATPAAAALPGANLSADALNFTWTSHSAAASPRPPSRNAPLVTGTGVATGTVSGIKDISQSRMSTPNAQLPLFGASPVPVAPASTFATGNGYLGMIDTGLPCDITPLTSLSSPGGHSDDSNWKWDPSQNSLMNLASLSQCVLSTDSSPTGVVLGGDHSCSSDLTSVSSALFANGGSGSGRRSNHDSGKSRSSGQSRRRNGDGGNGVEGSILGASRHTPTMASSIMRPLAETSERQMCLQSRSLDSADTPNAAYLSPMCVTGGIVGTIGSGSSSGLGIANRGSAEGSPDKSTHEMNPPLSQPRSKKVLRSSTASAATSVASHNSSSIDEDAEGSVFGCSMQPSPAMGIGKKATSAVDPTSEEGSEESQNVERADGALEKEDSTDQEEGSKTPSKYGTTTRKRKHHHCTRASTEADDNIMRVAIGDVKRLRMLSPAMNAVSLSNPTGGKSDENAAPETVSAEEEGNNVSDSTPGGGRRLTRRSTAAGPNGSAPHRRPPRSSRSGITS